MILRDAQSERIEGFLQRKVDDPGRHSEENHLAAHFREPEALWLCTRRRRLLDGHQSCAH